MTVWILALIFPQQRTTYARCQVISRVTKTSACNRILIINHWHRLWEIPATTGIKSNITAFNYICPFIVSFIFNGFKPPILKAWGRTSRAQRLLPTGIVRRRFPSRGTTSSRGTTWRNNGSRTRNGSRFEHHVRMETTDIHEVKLKMPCYNCD